MKDLPTYTGPTYTAENGHTGVLIRSKWNFINGYAKKIYGENWKSAIMNSPQEVKTYTMEQLAAL